MKKIISLIFICAVSILLFGCSKKEELKNTYDIEFESNPSTGYTWSYTMSKENVIKFSKDEYVDPENTAGMTGVPGKQIYQLTGVTKGEVEINFTYKRPWEESTNDAKGYLYKFKVDKNLNIKLISKDEWIN